MLSTSQPTHVLFTEDGVPRRRGVEQSEGRDTHLVWSHTEVSSATSTISSGTSSSRTSRSPSGSNRECDDVAELHEVFGTSRTRRCKRDIFATPPADHLCWRSGRIQAMPAPAQSSLTPPPRTRRVSLPSSHRVWADPVGRYRQDVATGTETFESMTDAPGESASSDPGAYESAAISSAGEGDASRCLRRRLAALRGSSNRRMRAYPPRDLPYLGCDHGPFSSESRPSTPAAHAATDVPERNFKEGHVEQVNILSSPEDHFGHEPERPEPKAQPDLRSAAHKDMLAMQVEDSSDAVGANTVTTKLNTSQAELRDAKKVDNELDVEAATLQAQIANAASELQERVHEWSHDAAILSEKWHSEHSAVEESSIAAPRQARKGRRKARAKANWSSRSPEAVSNEDASPSLHSGLVSRRLSRNRLAEALEAEGSPVPETPGHPDEQASSDWRAVCHIVWDEQGLQRQVAGSETGAGHTIWDSCSSAASTPEPRAQLH